MAQSNGISSNNTRIYEVLISMAVVFWVLHVAYIYWNWAFLPEKIPIHFDLLNNPDSWRSKKALIIIPLIHFAILALLSSISLIKPAEMSHYDYKDQNPKQVHLSKLMLLSLLLIISLLFFNISYTSISIALNQAVLFKQSSLVLLAAIFVCMGFYMFLIKRAKNADENL